jgi:hypothetical protein
LVCSVWLKLDLHNELEPCLIRAALWDTMEFNIRLNSCRRFSLSILGKKSESIARKGIEHRRTTCYKAFGLSNNERQSSWSTEASTCCGIQPLWMVCVMSGISDRKTRTVLYRKNPRKTGRGILTWFSFGPQGPSSWNW